MDQPSEQIGGNAQEASSSPTVPLTTTEVPVATSEDTSPMLMGILSYLGILVLIPYFLSKNNSFVKFHIKQGLVLLVIEAILWVLGEMMLTHILTPIIALLNLGLLVLSIIGIVNVIQKKEAPLPLVGAYSSHFKF